MFIGHALVVAVSGYGPGWLTALLAVAPELTSDFNFGPSAVIGLVWVLIGAVICGVAHGPRPFRLASLAASP